VFRINLTTSQSNAGTATTDPPPHLRASSAGPRVSDHSHEHTTTSTAAAPAKTTTASSGHISPPQGGHGHVHAASEGLPSHHQQHGHGHHPTIAAGAQSSSTIELSSVSVGAIQTPKPNASTFVLTHETPSNGASQHHPHHHVAPLALPGVVSDAPASPTPPRVLPPVHHHHNPPSSHAAVAHAHPTGAAHGHVAVNIHSQPHTTSSATGTAASGHHGLPPPSSL
jgi:hypothetical protein